MPILTQIKLFLARLFASQNRDKVMRRLELQSWHKIKSVGLLYIVPEENEYARFTELAAWLQSQKKEVKALGFLKSGQIPHYCFPKIAFDYFSIKNINWLGKPSGDKVNDFINKEFDLLINLEFSDNPFFDYIIHHSKAKLKAGIYHEQNSGLFDLMIHDPEVTDKKVLMNHIIRYLEVLKSPKTRNVSAVRG